MVITFAETSYKWYQNRSQNRGRIPSSPPLYDNTTSIVYMGIVMSQ